MSSIVNLKNYDITITTSFEFKFGVCGHLFEMIDYYWAIKNYTNLNPCILLSDGTTVDEFLDSVNKKYDNITIDNLVYHPQPKVILANNLLIVDGSPRLKNADIFAENIFLFRCSENDFSYFTKTKAQVFLLQDFEVYDDRPINLNLVDYKKKILFSKYKPLLNDVDEAAMFYLTDVCRAMSQEDVEQAFKKHGFSKNIVLTNNTDLYNLDNVYKVPVDDIWNKFTTYVYTKVPRQIDCSSRFILECLFYNKTVIYDIDYYDRALEVRKKDGLVGTALLEDDNFLKILNEQIKCRSN